MRWQHLDQKIEDRIAAAIQPWSGTPYMPGQQKPGIGVDCVRFVTGVLDTLYGLKRDITALPLDTCMHDPDKAVRTMLGILRLYPNEVLDDLSVVEPGDVLLTGTSEAPGHAMLAGVLDNRLWHADGKRVVSTAPRFGRGSLSRLYRIIRPENKESWI
jgi:hypothetical protein